MNSGFIKEDVRRILNGSIIQYTSTYLNRVIALLEKEDHNGIVLTGNNPTLVSVIKKPVAAGFEVGKYYKYTGKGSNNRVFQVVSIDEYKFVYRYVDELYDLACSTYNMTRKDYVRVVAADWKEV